MNSVSLRHLVHYKYRNAFIPGIAALVFFNAYVVWMFLPKEIIVAGTILSLAVLVYFLLVHFTKWHISKEFFVSIIVCVGMVVLPGLYGDITFTWPSILLVTTMILINYTNLLLFSFYDIDSDLKNGLESAATQWGVPRTKSMILYTLGVAFFAFFCWLMLVNSPVKLVVSVTFLLMFNVLLILYIQEERFAKNEQYRFWGDFIYLIPGLVWWGLSHKDFF